MRKPEQIAVVGVTGYTGFELARIVLRHRAVKSPVFYVRETQRQTSAFAELFPQLRGVGEAPLRSLSVGGDSSPATPGPAFLATPHEVFRGNRASAPSKPPARRRSQRRLPFSFRDTFASWYKLPTPTQTGQPKPSTVSRAVRQRDRLLAPCRQSRLLRHQRHSCSTPPCRSSLIAEGSQGRLATASPAPAAARIARRDLHFVEVEKNFKGLQTCFPIRHTRNPRTHRLVEDRLVFSTHLLRWSRNSCHHYVTLGVMRVPARKSKPSSASSTLAAHGAHLARWFVAPSVQHVGIPISAISVLVSGQIGKRLIVVSCLDNLGKGAASAGVSKFQSDVRHQEHTALQ